MQPQKDTPPPGSNEALDQGCACPVMNNGHGRGYLGGVKDEYGETVYVICEACPLHSLVAALLEP